MMFKLIERFSTIISDNPLLATLAGLWGASILLFLFKSIPITIIRFLKKQITTTLTLTSSNMSYFYFMKFLKQMGYDKKFRYIKINNGKWGDNATGKGFGYGQQILKIGKKRVFVCLEELKSESGSSMEKDKVSLTIFGRNHRYFDWLIEKIKKADRERNYSRVYLWNCGNWGEGKKLIDRSIETIIMKKYDKKRIITAIERFYESEDFYHDRGIPYHLGILLYGPPGTGKTSLVKALANKYKKDIYFIASIGYGELYKATQIAPDNCFILIEDIDSNSVIVKRENTNKMEDVYEGLLPFPSSSFSEILNTLDGVMARHGRVLFATTNHIENIDPAVLRPGRIDIQIKMDYVSIEDFKEAIHIFYKEKSYNTKAIIKKECTVSSLQNDFLKGLTLQEMEDKYLKVV